MIQTVWIIGHSLLEFVSDFEIGSFKFFARVLRPIVGWACAAVGQAFQPDRQVRLESLTYCVEMQ
jgi:hypothetical protein